MEYLSIKQSLSEFLEIIFLNNLYFLAVLSGLDNFQPRHQANIKPSSSLKLNWELRLPFVGALMG